MELPEIFALIVSSVQTINLYMITRLSKQVEIVSTNLREHELNRGIHTNG